MPSELRVDKVSSTTSPYDPVFSTTGGALSHRNLIINGAMQVHQRVATNTLVQASNASNTTGLTVDRFKFWENTDGTYQTKHNAVTDLAGFTSSLYLSPNQADTSIASGQYAFFAQLIEAQNLQHLAYGTASAKTMTLSFYIKSNLTGKMTAYVAKYDNTTRIVPLEFDLPSSAGTWERITLTVPALTETAAGVINNDNGMGLEIGWYMTAGSTYKVGTSGTWSSNSNGYSTANHNINFMGSTSNYIEITGVQLELGTVATPFEHRSYADELRRCQRYYYKPENTVNAYLGKGHMYETGTVHLLIPHPVTMRTASVTVEADYGSQHFYLIETSSTNSYIATNWSVFLNGENATLIQAGSVSNMTLARPVDVKISESTAYVALNAEI